MTGKKIIAKNKRAAFDFTLSDRYEAGLVLKGTEVKVLRQGKANINDAHIQIDQKGEAWIYNMLIPHYEFGNIANHEEARKRKLLLHDQEIATIYKSINQQALTIVPTILYFKGRHVKIEIALAKGKKLHDKRADKAKKDVERKLQQGDYT